MSKKGAIIRFRKGYRFLSNFYDCEIEYEGRIYSSVEHAFQAAKTIDDNEREKVWDCTSAAAAKRLGRTVTLRSDWEKVKALIMLELVRKKFQDEELAKWLMSTGEMVLVESNSWHDKSWGVCYCEKCDGKGLNYLGRILMHVRDELNAKKRLGAMKWAYDAGNELNQGYKNCQSLWCPEDGRKGMVWQTEDDYWSWDVGHDRGRERTMDLAKDKVEEIVRG